MYEELKEFGLSENEINIYIELLKTGTTTANRISKLTGIKRSTTYDNLHLLGNKGLVSSIVKEKVNYFEAIDPKKIMRLMDEKKEKLGKVVKELSSLREVKREESGASFFEGKKGIITILNDILDEKSELWFYGSRKEAQAALNKYPDNFVLKRAELGIKLRAVMAEEDREDKSMKNKKVYVLSTIRFLKTLNKIPTNVFIYGNKVAFMTSGNNLSGTIIKNKEVVKQQKIIFENLWKISKS